jgi:hypothetical protein
MTSTTPRIITIALAMLALAVPAANAMPLYEHDGSQSSGRNSADIRTGSLAGTTSNPVQDLRNPDLQAPLPPETVAPKQDLRNPDQQAPGIQPAPPAQQPYTYAPVQPPKAVPAVVHHDSDPSPFWFIIPSVVLIALLGAAFAFMRTSRPVRRSVA